MSWIIYAILAWISTGTTFLLLRNTGSVVSKNVKLQIMYILVSFVISGFLSLIILIYYITNDKSILTNIYKFEKINITILGILLVLSYIFLELAGNKGGSAAFQIANLNIIISVVGGYIFYKEKLNPLQYFGIFLAIISAGIIGGGKTLYKYI
tara:strand:+ start:489 stop:947 length:459 start_codon:yes stop_codon:yes gene_type:complete